MENLPIYIPLVFLLTLIIGILFFYQATGFSGGFLAIVIIWLTLLTVLSISGFYLQENMTPPRFLLAPLPPFIVIILLFLTKSGRAFVDRMNLKTLTIFHCVRIPVELVLYWLFIWKMVPKTMTFEGTNLDILSGLTAPLVYYYAFVKKKLGNAGLLIWNIICLGLLINVVIKAILSLPTPLQRIAFDQPNTAVLHFPFVLLPGCLVPLVVLAHLTAIRQLLRSKESKIGSGSLT